MAAEPPFYPKIPANRIRPAMSSPDVSWRGDEDVTNVTRAFRNSLWGSPALTFDAVKPLAYSIRTPRLSGRDSSIIVNSDEIHERRITTHIKEHPTVTRKRKARRNWVWFTAASIGIFIVVVVALAVIIPLVLHFRSKESSNASNTATGTSAGTTARYTIGRDGTTVRTETGDSFVYRNGFGGFFVDDPNDPFNSNAQAQSWSQPLNESWDWTYGIIRGVNLGGWLVLEPFIVPSLFERYANISSPPHDEWSLSKCMAADTASGGLSQLEQHYATFITEEDFAQIAGAGLNWIRLPIPFWAVQSYGAEPFLEGVAWKYVLKALNWARKYGIRINLDLHTVPGSQNGYNHSGKQGEINFLYGPMGLANAQRTLDYLRVITEFITQPQYGNVVQMLGLVNEPISTRIGDDVMTSFYMEAHNIIRNITGYGPNRGPYLSVHDGFEGLDHWSTLLPGSDRIALDTHPYLIFYGDISEAPLSEQVNTPCGWADAMNASWANYGVSIAGEWSLAINDCGKWINGVGNGAKWDGTVNGGANTRGDGVNSCADWNNYEGWTTDRKADFVDFALHSMDALQHWFFWTWKIGPSSVTGKIEAPMWSYQLGLQNGYMPTDPRLSVGKCGGKSPVILKGHAAGQAGPLIWATVQRKYEWPPSIQPGNWNATDLPQYTQTGVIPTLPIASITAAQTVQAGNGWFDASDIKPIYTPIFGCSYPDAWAADGVDNPGPCETTITSATARMMMRKAATPIRTPGP